jgi:hypothetical protein
MGTHRFGRRCACNLAEANGTMARRPRARRVATGNPGKSSLESAMIDETLLYPLELCVLTVLIGAGLWRIYRARHATTIASPAPEVRDMRHDGQQLGI